MIRTGIHCSPGPTPDVKFREGEASAIRFGWLEYSQVMLALWAFLMAFVLAGCSTLPRGEAVPIPLAMRASTPESPKSRYWPNLDMEAMLQDAVASDDRERQALLKEGRTAEQLPPADYLAISGGGDKGPFAMGLLVGWTAYGHRPDFKLVTGISAGALIAPFAFLGPKYDGILRTASTSIGPRDVFRVRSLLHVIYGDSYADNARLEAIITKYVTRELLDEIAREYARGRLLLIGTTNLDTSQPVVWNMGEIAASKDPRALILFRRVLLASAAIPGMFPPVMIDVEVDGKHYQEMHVDGGVVTQVFLAPPQLVQELNHPGTRYARERHLYVIRNGRVESQGRPVPRRTARVAGQALDTLIESQGLNDLYRLEVTAEREGEAFSVAYMDSGFNRSHTVAFASDFMGDLFEYSYSLASHGYPWRNKLPGQGGSPAKDCGLALASGAPGVSRP